MSYLWTPEEDRILVQGYDAGLSDRQIVDALVEHGFSRNMGSVQHRRGCFKLGRARGSKPSAWTPQEDAIIKSCADAGYSKSQMSRALSDAGYYRSSDACAGRASRIGAKLTSDEREDLPPTSDPLADALRKAHPDREGRQRALYDKSVPARISGTHKFSITGSQF